MTRRTFQPLHPTHLKQLKEACALHGRRTVEQHIGLGINSLKGALSGKGVYPSTISKVAAYFAPKPANAAAVAVVPPPPKRDPLQGVADKLKELGAATALVLEVLSGVAPENRSRVLDAARAALG